MLCDVCQTRQAKIFYTEIINGQKKEQHLCEQCASEHTAVPLNELLGGQGLSAIGSILSGIMSNYAQDRGKALTSENRIETTCPECGTTESDFLKTGRTGCPVCYNVFRDMIAKNFKTMQGGMKHVGKEPAYAKYIEIEDSIPQTLRSDAKLTDLDKKLQIPNGEETELTEKIPETKKKTAGKRSSSRKSREEKISELKNKLKQAIEIEDYELAAGLRDEIKALEVKNEKKKK
ncbi:MAG: UvrB/UvrC motif-containing protein [Lachnospiraceae bacterium]|nr:UvrB/UvrC motif-containing protein [Lachnospiraceae bacterium]